MKHTLSQTPRGRTAEHGIALVLVLFFLVILSGIVVAFFSSVTTESNSAASYAAGASAKMLSDAVVNMVEAQLQDATKGTDPSSPTQLSWASQPGAIHTFDSSGTAKNVYKLYSADDLVVPDSTFKLGNDSSQIPGDWDNTKYTDVYTDLNQSVADSTGTPIYPIVDPDAEDKAFSVLGFSIDANSPGASVNKASMPVKWLYLLQDGTLSAVSTPSSDTNTVSVPGATVNNPIVGRVAFWTDDEAAKVNINTASEGTYWDVPRAYTMDDYGMYQGSGNAVATPGLSICQPAQHEFQRYPGHPATTCLSPILGAHTAAAFYPSSQTYPASITATDAQKIDRYYQVAPRVNFGGSESGTKQPTDVMPFKQDRLYASIDELVFSTTFNAATPGSRTPNLPSGPAAFDKATLEKVKFFLTANSNAPETTLFNTPRISIWPVNSNTAKQTAYDKLSVFCTTIGKQAYYFPRSNPRDQKADYTARNQTLYKYLQAETSQNIPGFGGNFLAKYPAGNGPSDRDQILTYIYDYIRCTNTQDRSTGATPYTPVFIQPAPLAAGEVIPIQIGATQGFGRFYTVSEADLLFYATQLTGNSTGLNALLVMQFSTPLQGLGCMRSNLSYTVSGLEKLQVQFNGGQWTSLGFVASGGANGTNGTNYMDWADLDSYHGRSLGGTEGPIQAFLYHAGAVGAVTGTETVKSFMPGSNSHTQYPFCTTPATPVSIPANATSFGFRSSSGSDEVVIQIKSTDTNQLIQTLHMQFPTGTFKVPAVGSPSISSGSPQSLVPSTATVVGLQVGGIAPNTPGPSADPTAGDTRMVEGLINVPASRFRAHQDYQKPGTPVQWAHGLLPAVGETYYAGGTWGKLARGVSSYKQYDITRNPAIPSRVLNGAYRADGGPGDWDTGVGDQKDGAYINKPDEGDSAYTDVQNGLDRLPYLFGFGHGFASGTSANFSPNRQISSAMMFGSIPTGVQRMRPWQTLSFCPRPEDLSHPGNQSPRDHLIADLFWMPVIEPYAISQPFSTAGKINLNYQIQPFTYIHRSTGLYAVLKSTKFLALAAADSMTYKPIDPGGSTSNRIQGTRRYAINIDETIKDFDQKFAKGEVFRSATQICEMNLIPQTAGTTSKQMAAFWSTHTLTGDNVREKPYADIYPRLTTKSNTFTVHMRVQSLRKARNTPPDQWVHGKDLVAGEYRGSAIIERYIDPNDPSLPDFAALMAANPSDPKLNIDQYYKMRIVSTKQFSPD